jgi:peptidyl-prolyl cis-trans isomerase B (cyclophilin B)
LRVAALLLAALALLAAGCGGDDEPTTATDAFSTTETGTAGGDTTAETETSSGSGECDPVELPAPKPDGGQTAPTEPLDPAKTYELVVDTNCGSFTVTLDVKGAPKTAASLVALAEDGFFDDLTFHRIVPGFVIQGGDPTGTGTGGPGYTTVDVPAPGAAYTKGVVAMAKGGIDPPGSSGSQFFVVTADDAGLPPDYAIVGEVTEGLGVVETIGTLGDPATEQPLEPVVIEKITVETS